MFLEFLPGSWKIGYGDKGSRHVKRTATREGEYSLIPLQGYVRSTFGYHQAKLQHISTERASCIATVVKVQMRRCNVHARQSKVRPRVEDKARRTAMARPEIDHPDPG